MFTQLGAFKWLLFSVLLASCLVPNLDSIDLDSNLSITKEILSKSKDYNKLVDSFRKNWESPLAYLIQRGYIPKEDVQPDKHSQVIIKKMQEEYSEKSKEQNDVNFTKDSSKSSDFLHLQKKRANDNQCKNVTNICTTPKTGVLTTTSKSKGNKPTPELQSDCEEYYDNVTECYEYEVYEDGTRVTTASPKGAALNATPANAVNLTTDLAAVKPTLTKLKPAELSEGNKKEDIVELTSQSPFKFHFFCPAQQADASLASNTQSKPNELTTDQKTVASTNEHKNALALATEIAKNTVAEYQKNNYQPQATVKKVKEPYERLKRERPYPYQLSPYFYSMPSPWQNEIRPLRRDLLDSSSLNSNFNLNLDSNSKKHESWHPGHPTSPTRPSSYSSRTQYQPKSSFKNIKLQHSKPKPSTQSAGFNMASKYGTNSESNLMQQLPSPSKSKDNGASFKSHSGPDKNSYFYSDDDNDNDYNPDYLAVNAIYLVNKNKEKPQVAPASKSNLYPSNQKSSGLFSQVMHYKPQISNLKLNKHNWPELTSKNKANPVKHKMLEGTKLAGQKPKTQYSNTPGFSSQDDNTPWENVEHVKPQNSNPQWTNYNEKTNPMWKPRTDGKFLNNYGPGPHSKNGFLTATNLGSKNSNNYVKTFNYDAPVKSSTALKTPNLISSSLLNEPLLDTSEFNFSNNSNSLESDYHDRKEDRLGGSKDDGSYPSQALLNLYRYKNMNKNLENIFIPVNDFKSDSNVAPKANQNKQTSLKENANKTKQTLKSDAKLSSDADMHTKCLSIIDMAVRNATGTRLGTFSHLQAISERPKPVQQPAQKLQPTTQQKTPANPVASFDLPDL